MEGTTLPPPVRKFLDRVFNLNFSVGSAPIWVDFTVFHEEMIKEMFAHLSDFVKHLPPVEERDPSENRITFYFLAFPFTSSNVDPGVSGVMNHIADADNLSFEVLPEVADAVRKVIGIEVDTPKKTKAKKSKVSTTKTGKKSKVKKAPKKSKAKQVKIEPAKAKFAFVREVELAEDFDAKSLSTPDRWPIYSVTFPITRYEEFSHTLKFKKGVSEKKAIDEVEKYLSQPMTEPYWNKIKSDLEGYMEYTGKELRADAVGGEDSVFITDIISFTDKDDVPKDRQSAKGKRHVVITYEH
jgi:hypothetical protein